MIQEDNWVSERLQRRGNLTFLPYLQPTLHAAGRWGWQQMLTLYMNYLLNLDASIRSLHFGPRSLCLSECFVFLREILSRRKQCETYGMQLCGMCSSVNIGLYWFCIVFQLCNGFQLLPFVTNAAYIGLCSLQLSCLTYCLFWAEVLMPM